MGRRKKRKRGDGERKIKERSVWSGKKGWKGEKGRRKKKGEGRWGIGDEMGDE